MKQRGEPDLYIFYRSVGGDNPKGRPSYFSKMLCLQSLLCSLHPVIERTRIVFVNDGPMPDDRLDVMRNWGEIVSLPGLGNSASYRETLKLAVESPKDSLVYMAEDDYLYTPEAFPKLLRAFEELPDVEYFTLFDHLDRYRRHDDSRAGFSRMYLAADHHWRTVESTCMTYGARARTLRTDAWIHRIATVPNTPRDRVLWRLTQGQKQFLLKFPKRILIGPVPSLATHMDPPSLAPNINWEEVARDVEQDWKTMVGKS